MENHSLVGDAVQMAGDAANFFGQKVLVPAALSVATALSSPAGATELAPVASQVAPIKVEVTKATLQGLKIDPDSLADFDKLAAANQGKVLFFLDGLKKAQKFPDTAAEKLPSLKEAAEKLIFLFENDQINKASRDAMSKMDGTLGKVRKVDQLITELSNSATYGAVLASPDSAYGQRFSQVKQEMLDTYAEAYKLYLVAKNMDSPKLAEAKKREADSAAALAATRAERANVQRTNAALDQVLATARKH